MATMSEAAINGQTLATAGSETTAEVSIAPRSRKASVSATPKATSRPTSQTPVSRAVLVEHAKFSQPEVYIAVLGQTGTGKSTFINNVLGHSKERILEGVKFMKVGHRLDSCTSSIEVATTVIQGYKVHMIDTLGFDEEERDDADILILVSKWLKEAHSEKRLLSGVIYLHRISDQRMGGGSVRSLHILEKMCGKSTYENIALATTMWHLVDEKLGLDREQQLKSKYWHDVIAGGGRVYRHNEEVASARKIVSDILPKQPRILSLQRELLNNSIVADTTAGAYIYEFLQKLNELEKPKLLELNKRVKELEEENRDKELEKKMLEKTLVETRSELAKTEDKVNKLEEQMARLKTKIEELEGIPLEEARNDRERAFLARLWAAWRPFA